MWYNSHRITKGVQFFMPRGVYKKYTGEFKQKVVEHMRKAGISLQEAADKYGVKSKTQVQRWERIYHEEGAEGLYIERRGRASGSKTGRPPKFDTKVEGDLIAENQRLRAEVAYLKKLNALVSKRVQQEKKHK